MSDESKEESDKKKIGELTVEKVNELGGFAGRELSKASEVQHLLMENHKAVADMLDPESLSVAQSIAKDIEKNRHVLEMIDRKPQITLEDRVKSISNLQFDNPILEKTFEAIKEQNAMLEKRNSMLVEQAEDSDRKFNVMLVITIFSVIVSIITLILS